MINPLTPGAFCKKMRLLDILVVFRLDLCQISFNPVKNAFTTQQLAFLATRIAFYHIDSGMRRNQNFRGFAFWKFFSPFPFLLFFSVCCSDSPSTGLACVKNTSTKTSSRRAIFSMEQPGVVAVNFALSFSL